MEVETIKKFNHDIDTVCTMLSQVGEQFKSLKLAVNEVCADLLKASPSFKCDGCGDSTLGQLQKVASKLEDLATKKVNNGVDGSSSDASAVIKVTTHAKTTHEVEEFLDAETGTDVQQCEQMVKPKLPRMSVTPKCIKAPVNYVQVETGRFVPIILTAVNSSRNFYVHLKTDSTILGNFYQELNDFYFGVDLEKFKVLGFKMNQLYVYFYDLDQTYYRAIVTDFVSNNQLKFILIDLGTESIGVLKDFYRLEPKFDDKHMPVFAVPCFVQDCWTKSFQIYDSALEKMFQNPKEFKIQAKFSEPLQNGYLPVTLKVEMPDGLYNLHDYDFTCDINDEYIKNFFEVQTFLADNNILYDKEMIASAYEKFNECYPFSQAVEIFDPICLKVMDISNFVCAFNVIQGGDGWELVNFTNNITLFYKHMQSLDEVVGRWNGKDEHGIKVEQLVVFKLDKYFIRGYILSISVRDVYNVFAFDFGFVIALSTSMLYPMFDIFSPDVVPPFAIFCCLDNAEPIKNNWSTIAINQFQNYVKENFSISINRAMKGKFYVNVTNGIKDIVSIFKRLKFAK